MDTTTTEDDKPFCVERAKQGRAACKKCKQKCAQGELRIAKLTNNPFGDGKMKSWHHLDCIFEQFLKQRVNTKRIQNFDDLDGWNDLNDDDKKEITQKINECEKLVAEKYHLPEPVPLSLDAKPKNVRATSPSKPSTSSASVPSKKVEKDVYFREFRRLVAEISNVSAYLEKTELVRNLFTKGTDGKGFKGDVAQWCRLLLPGVVKRIYNLQSKQLIKLFAKIFHQNQNDMLEHLKSNDIGETIQLYFETSKYFKPAQKSTLTLQEVDDFLEELSSLTKEDEQTVHFEKFASRCTGNDLKTAIRLIKHDLRMNAGAKHILDAVHQDAYQTFQASRNLKEVISRCLGGQTKASIRVMTAVQPMLAEACKSVDQAIKKCPNGMYAEIKYDGERVQLHKEGNVFRYFSRSLKPVLPHKVSHFKNVIPLAFPKGEDLILDSEILMIDTETGQPLPFGTLGIHKKSEFQNANVCLFVFDCIYYNGESLVGKPLDYRKQILKENMTEIPNRILFSEMELIKKPKQLSRMIAKVLEMGLEGLVLKDLKSIYEPGKRHWLKVKKDYLFDGVMADTADLIVLGAWYGTGKKAGMMSVFLMGCYDQRSHKFCTVTKVHTGHDDKTLASLQNDLKMIKINCELAQVPNWLRCTKTMIPDFVAEDPRAQPVWEITGAEFTQHDVHTADGISIRFPRVTKMRDDKTWKEATNLEELNVLYRTSKENTDYSKLLGVKKEESGDEEERDESDSFEKSDKKLIKKIKQEKIEFDSNVSTDIETDELMDKKKIKLEKIEFESNVSTDVETDDLIDKKKIKKEIVVKTESDDVSTSKKNKRKKKKRQRETSMDTDSPISEDEKINKKRKANDDTKIKNKNIRKTVIIKDPLPNIFEDVYLLIDDSKEIKDADEWLRHFVAFGGNLVKPVHWESATYVLHARKKVSDQNMMCAKNARHVNLKWLKDSVKTMTLQDFRPYTVKLLNF